MTPRTFSRLPTHQSPSSSCGPFSTFSHRWTLNKIFCLEKLNFSLIRSPPFWCSTPSPTLPTSWCGAWPFLGPPGPMPSTGSANTNKIVKLVLISLSLSGEFSGVGVQIEELTGKVWDNCFQPILNKVNCLFSSPLSELLCLCPFAPIYELWN